MANVLQVAAPLADRLRVVTAKSAEDADALLAAIARAITAVKAL